MDRKTGATATVRDARRYLSRLKESDVSSTVYSHASAALRFFFEEVRGLSWKPISELRQRRIDDMHLHRFSPKTQASYVRSVEGLSCYFMRSPDRLSEEDIRKYFVHLTRERKRAHGPLCLSNPIPSPAMTAPAPTIPRLPEKPPWPTWTAQGLPEPRETDHLRADDERSIPCREPFAAPGCPRIPRRGPVDTPPTVPPH